MLNQGPPHCRVLAFSLGLIAAASTSTLAGNITTPLLRFLAAADSAEIRLAHLPKQQREKALDQVRFLQDRVLRDHSTADSCEIQLYEILSADPLPGEQLERQRAELLARLEMDGRPAISASDEPRVKELSVIKHGGLKARSNFELTQWAARLDRLLAGAQADMPGDPAGYAALAQLRLIQKALPAEQAQRMGQAYESLRDQVRSGAAFDPNSFFDASFISPPDPVIAHAQAPSRFSLNHLSSRGGHYRADRGQKRNIPIKDLPPISVNGKLTRPFGFTTDMDIDADGDGSAWKRDFTGQSRTSLRYPDGRSLDPEKIPFIVLPLGYQSLHPDLRLGDLAAVIYRGKIAFAIFGDAGPRKQLGEGSIHLAMELGVDPDPNEGGTDQGVIYIVFPGSGDGTPLDLKAIQERGAALWEKISI